MWNFLFHLTCRDRGHHFRSPLLFGDWEKPRQNSGEGLSPRWSHSWILRGSVHTLHSDHCCHSDSQPAACKNCGERSVGCGISPELRILRWANMPPSARKSDSRSLLPILVKDLAIANEPICWIIPWAPTNRLSPVIIFTTSPAEPDDLGQVDELHYHSRSGQPN